MRKIAFLLVVLLVLGGLGGSALASSVRETDTVFSAGDRQNIESLLTGYLYAVFDSLDLSSTNVSFLDEYFAPEAQSTLDYEKAFLGTKIQHHKQQEADLRLLNYNIAIIYDGFNIYSNYAQVQLHITGTRTYAYDNTPQSIANEIHSFELAKTTNGWKIVKHSWNENLEQDFRSYYDKNNKNAKRAMQAALTDIGADTMARKRAALTDKNIEPRNENGFSAKAYSNSYNRTAFSNYGLQWHSGSNPNYIVRGADCANFGSQCLKAGGAPDDKVGKTDLQWYYDGNQRYSWYAAQGLRYYLLNNDGSSSNIGVKANKVTSISSVYEGDFAFNIDSSNRATHTIPIVGSYYSSNGVKVDLYIVQHSSSPSYGLLSQVTLSGRTRELVRITGVYK